jgi:pilus assembly protein CpaC
MRRSLITSLACAALAAASFGLLSLAAATEASAQHRSYLRVGEGGARQVKLGLNKSMIVELPREVREVMVSNPGQIEAVLQTSTRAYLIGKAPGEANILFTDNDGRQVVVLEVTIERDLAAVGQLLNTLLHGSRIQVQTVGTGVVLSGSVTAPVDAARACKIVNSYLAQEPVAGSTSSSGPGSAMSVNVSTGGGGTEEAQYCKGIINMLTVEGREQVLLKVSVVEMNRNIIKQFGVNLDALINSGNFAFSVFSGLPFPNTGGLIRGIATGGVGWTSGASNVSGILQALEQSNMLRTLAEPNLTAISGETANFLAGGEFPIPVNQSAGTGANNSAITVEFKQFGVGLAFTPVVMSEGRISLKVSTEVSELSSEGAVILQGIAIPALKVRRAETVVELPSGGSLVMAGLLSDHSKQAISGYPVLKNIPVLGTLFRSRDFIKNETELVVLVTPYVVDPVARQQLSTPSDGFGWAHDVNADLLGQMNRIYGRTPESAPVGQFNGDVGFIVE